MSQNELETLPHARYKDQLKMCQRVNARAKTMKYILHSIYCIYILNSIIIVVYICNNTIFYYILK